MKYIKLVFLMILILAFVSCEFLQSSLSSEQTEVVESETGSASIASKTWYYNGTSSTDASKFSEVSGVNYMDHSVKFDFGKQVALDSLIGYLTVEYSDSNGLTSTKQFSNLRGTFSSDYKSFNLNMNDVLTLFDTVEIPSGTANLEIKLDGFLCAEGNQSGRPIPAYNKVISIAPLYQTVEIDYSTCWCDSDDVISIPLNAETTLSNSDYSITRKNSIGDDLTFKIEIDSSTLNLIPSVNLHGKNGFYIELPVSGIVPIASGSEYEQTFKINFVSSAIIIDGEVDENYSSSYATQLEDVVGDQGAFSYTTGMGDLSGISVLNDDDNLYIGISGDLAVTWNDGIVLLISKDTTDSSTSSTYKPSTTCSYKNGKPSVYLYHQPGYENSGAGDYKVYSNNTDISSLVSVAPMGWTDTTSKSFTEYSIPLSSIGVVADDELKIIACVSLHWDEGEAVCDILPDAAVSKYTEEGATVIFDFSKAMTYSVQ